MARMSIDDKFLRDPRVTRLAEALGWNRYEARGRLLDVFAVCYDLETDIITPEDANAAADEARLADVMLAVGLADLDDGGIRVHGAAERIGKLQTSHHSMLEVIGVVDGDVEQAIHRELDLLGKRRRGEWFDLDARTELVLADHGIGRSR